jgi:uncharacterized protein (TIGR03066 family)
MKSRSKQQRKHQPARPPQAAPRGAGSPRRALVLALAVLAVGAGTWALFEYVIWNTTPSELVGTWVITQGPADQRGAVFEFFRNGTLVGHIDPEGSHQIVNARIRVDGDKIYATTRHPRTGQELTRVQTIERLTKENLVLKDEQGNVLVMERAE